MKQKQQIIIPIILAGIIIACIFMITNNKSKEPTKEIITYTNTTEIKTTTENTITATEEMTTPETTEEITTTEEPKTTVKTNNSSSGNSNSGSNKTQNTLNTNKETTKAQTTKPVTTEKTTTYDSYYDASRYSVGYVTFNDPHGTSEDSAYWTTCVNEFVWCEDSQGTCETCFIDKEVYGFTGKGQWHCSDSLVISPSAENMQEIMSIAGRQRPNFDGEYEGQTYKIKFWVWDPC